MTRTSIKVLALAACVLGPAIEPSAAGAGSLENLERERAHLIKAMLDAGLAPAERHARVGSAARRLRDLERMAIRDDHLVGRNTPAVRRAFADYDLTFLVHAAGETGMSITDKWLEEVGVSTHSLMATRLGRR